ncbi:hypothetical protein VTH06DRAFT_5563 [Thermothelomyces fergusii]
MSLLSAHLEQISISCQGIDSLPFPPPKIFTNALLSKPDITTLIRDTEAHERALFSVPAPPPPPSSSSSSSQQTGSGPATAGRQGKAEAANAPSRRKTIFNVTAGEVTTGPPAGSSRGGGLAARRNTAVAAVLGGDLHAQIVRRGGPNQQQQGGDVDIEVLLHGAEKLCAVYALPGALERIPALRQKHAQQKATLAYYEAKVAEQQDALERLNLERVLDGDGGEEEEGEGGEGGGGEDEEEVGMTEEDLRREEEEARQLERRKRELQARLRALEADLGGLLNI